MLKYSGELDRKSYKKFFYKSFSEYYNFASKEQNISWFNFTENKTDKLLNFFRDNKHVLQRFAHFHALTVADGN